MLSLLDYYKKISSTHVYDVVQKTPLSQCENLSEKINNLVYLKREDLLPVFSFKLRGAFNKVAMLSTEERARGVIACSAGNHAQGLAFAGKHFGCKAVIVMPESTPSIKINAVKKLQAEVVLHGDSYQEAQERALELAKAHDYVFVHPFDDPDVIAGQGTIAAELVEQTQDIDYIFIPIGGGGLAAGIGAYLKKAWPNTKIIGVEPFEAPSMYESIKADKIVRLDWVGSFADGVAVKQVGEETFRICKEVLDDIVLVSTDEICSAIKDSFEDIRVLLEPAGAMSVAGMKKYVAEHKIQNKKIIGLACGANVNFDRLRHISERTDLGENREVVLAVELAEEPGSLRKFCDLLGRHSVTEFNYRFSEDHPAHIFVGISTQNPGDRDALFNKLSVAGVKFKDLSDNELAKVHIRYMVGGRPGECSTERIFRFEFPERAGALQDFLSRLHANWNISLFHYRCHGSDRGRVLVGLQVPERDQANLDANLRSIGFKFFEESTNKAYRLFLT